MPAKSKSQQRLMGMAHAYNKGELPSASKEVKEVAKSMKKKDTKDFAKTKHKGLPEHARKKKKKKSKKKKSNLLIYLVKLANHLDQRGLNEAADLVDGIFVKLSEEDEEIFKKPESEEELSYLGESELPKVEEYREPNLFWIQAVFKDGTKRLLYFPKWLIEKSKTQAEISSLTGEGKPLTEPPWSYEDVQAYMGVILTALKFFGPEAVGLDSETEKEFARKLHEEESKTINLEPPDEPPPIQIGKTSKLYPTGPEIDHLEIARYNLAGEFEGNPIGEVVAEVSLDGEINYLVSPEELRQKGTLEFLRNKTHPTEKRELQEISFHTDPSHRYLGKPPDREQAVEQHGERWKRRFDEAAKRRMESRYAPELYEGDFETEIPYGADIEEFEDSEDYNIFDQS